MPFTTYFESECIPEWRRVYIDYKGLRAMIAAIDKQRQQQQLPNRRSSVFSSQSAQDGGTEHDQFLQQQHQAGFTDQATTSGDGVVQQDDLGSVFSLLTRGTKRERLFYQILNEQLERVSQFYEEREHEAKSKFTALRIQLELVNDYGNLIQRMSDETQEEDEYESVEDEAQSLLHRGRKPNNPLWAMVPAAARWLIPTRYLHSVKNKDQIDFQVARSRLKQAFAEYYRNLQYLKSFKDLNYVGAQRLVRKFDKASGLKTSPVYLRKLKGYFWVESEEISKLIEKTEMLYADAFTDGNRSRAERNLRIKKSPKIYTSTCWRIGFYLGAAFVLLAYTGLLVANPKTWERIPDLVIHLRIYASFSVPILFALGVSVNMMVWSKCWINYKLIFELDPRNMMNYHQFAELPAFMILLLALSMYLDFSQILDPTIGSEWYPMIFFITIISIIICPFNILYRSARMWLCRSLGRVLMSYFLPVEFRDFFIADELNSLSYTFWTISYFFCAYSHRWALLGTHCRVTHMWVTPFLAALGPWWRFIQCIRRYQDSSEKVHLLNAIKYTTSIAATFTTAIRRMKPGPFMDILWILTSMTNSSYTSIWDIKQDWGLLHSTSRNMLLRDDLVFPRWIYYVAVPTNVVLRFAWALNFAGLVLHNEVLGYLTALMEAYRRIQWNFFRLENEHLNNCADYRAIHEIPLPFSAIPQDHKQFQRRDQQQPPASPSSHTSEPFSPPRDVSRLRLQRQSTWSYAIDPSTLSQPGSFYGRRDFESKPEQKRKAPRRGETIIPAVRQKSVSSAASSDSDTGNEDA